MKKILLLMAIILPFVLTSCGDDKDEPSTLEQQLIAEWVGSNDYYEFHYLFKSDHTGDYWVTKKGAPHLAPRQFKWSLTGNMLSFDYLDNSLGDDYTTEIIIDGNILKMFEEDDWFIYYKQP